MRSSVQILFSKNLVCVKKMTNIRYAYIYTLLLPTRAGNVQSSWLIEAVLSKDILCIFTLFQLYLVHHSISSALPGEQFLCCSLRHLEQSHTGLISLIFCKSHRFDYLQCNQSHTGFSFDQNSKNLDNVSSIIYDMCKRPTKNKI